MRSWYICGSRACPNDPSFLHDNFFGCVPEDFNPATGRSCSHWQRRVETAAGERYRWNGGCDAVAQPSQEAPQ